MLSPGRDLAFEVMPEGDEGMNHLDLRRGRSYTKALNKSIMCWITRGQRRVSLRGPRRSWQGLKHSQEVAGGSFVTLNREVALHLFLLGLFESS